MNEIIRSGNIQANPLYNCSFYSPEEWSKRLGITRPIHGIAEGVFGILIAIAYIPMINLMLEKDHYKMSCYKIMIFLAIVDVLSIVLICPIEGWLAYHGAVYCTYPNLIFLSGMSAQSLWCCSCVTALILVTNRLFDLLSSKASSFLFDGKRTYIVIFLAICYGLYFFFFTRPVLFNSKFHSWQYDPMIYEGRSSEYTNVATIYNNVLVVFATCLMYVVFCIALGSKLKSVSGPSESRNASIQIFFQSAMICTVNFVASMIFVSMNYIVVPPWLIIVGNLSWQLGHSAPVFIYLIFNKTIRNGILRKLGLKVDRNVVSILRDRFQKAIGFSKKQTKVMFSTSIGTGH
ncbi:hypothetical protein CRE_18575 [Caenorhabditis remanei]|uniref:Uncharacterized protein n=1 Tax=Caenorhabditis remanei TaxID=31234 RepID=E3LJX5_CAERE|nr:hypothetical protein CRE_18575 [Caenorhabditis remanei]